MCLQIYPFALFSSIHPRPSTLFKQTLYSLLKTYHPTQNFLMAALDILYKYLQYFFHILLRKKSFIWKSFMNVLISLFLALINLQQVFQ